MTDFRKVKNFSRICHIFFFFCGCCFFFKTLKNYLTIIYCIFVNNSCLNNNYFSFLKKYLLLHNNQVFLVFNFFLNSLWFFSARKQSIFFFITHAFKNMSTTVVFKRVWTPYRPFFIAFVLFLITISFFSSLRKGEVLLSQKIIGRSFSSFVRKNASNLGERNLWFLSPRLLFCGEVSILQIPLSEYLSPHISPNIFLS